ncbi:glutathione S-transferase family protein [Roseibium sp. SCP14]|uniref:glutathione S-transferase family protein n=1 Tax=Roseibium sp. SCP14 TaxID=3141375 RepID=UPI0033399D3F
MELYFAPNTISIAVAIVMEELELTFEARRIDFSTGEQTSADYARINPKGRVPALVTEDGIVTETGAILEYANAISPSSKLVPDDAFQAAKMREVMYYLASTMHVNHAHKLRGHRWANERTSFEDMRAKVPETMATSCAYVEDNLLQEPYVLGQEMSLADPYLYLICTWLEGDGVDISNYRKLSRFKSLMDERPSVRKLKSAGML